MKKNTKTVYLSAYVETPDGEIRCVDADEHHDGWTVQLRVPTLPDDIQPFDISIQEFYSDPKVALKNARAMARDHGCDLIDA